MAEGRSGNGLEKDKDVVAQAQAITALELFPRLLSIVNALSNLLSDSQAFWRVRIEAAFALATTASEETDWAGLLHLIKFYKSRRYDGEIRLPKPNEFHDFAEYFVLEAIPHAVALVRAADRKSPREAVDFILQLLKYNENNGNAYSDVFWLAALVQSVGELEFGQQSVSSLSSLVKRIDRLLQFDRLMPSYNGILTVSCIRALTQITLKLSEFIPLGRIIDLITPFCSHKTQWQVRIEASHALLHLEYHLTGIDAALILFIRYLDNEPSLRVKLAVHETRLCQITGDSDSDSDCDHGVVRETLVALLRLLESPTSFNNVTLRHYIFCIFQVLAGRPPTLCGVPRDETLSKGQTEICNELKNFFAAIVNQSKPPEHSIDTLTLPDDDGIPQPEFAIPDPPKEPHNSPEKIVILDSPEPIKEPDTISNSQEPKKPVLKIKMKQSSASSRAEETENNILPERSQGGHSSSVSVEAPPQTERISNEGVNVINQNLVDVNLCHDLGSRVTASIGSIKLAIDGNGDDLKELQCTADSSKVQLNDVDMENEKELEKEKEKEKENKFISLRVLNETDVAVLMGPAKEKKEKKKKDKEKKRKRKDKDDPEYSEKKRLKKEKELDKLLVSAPSVELKNKEKVKEEAGPAVVGPVAGNVVGTTVEDVGKRVETGSTTSTHKLKIKIKNRTLTRP